MKIVRQDTVGMIDMRLVRRPTNTTIGVDNFSLHATGEMQSWPVVRMWHLGVDERLALSKYADALESVIDLYGKVTIDAPADEVNANS